MSLTYKIAIIGAGPSGCTLAHLLLQIPSLHITIFESEPSLNSRSQGGCLDLHPSSGLYAMKRCNLFSAFEAYARYDGEALAFADKLNRRYITLRGSTDASSSRGRPEIDRAKLREILAGPLDERGVVKWGYKLSHVEGETGTLHFASVPAGAKKEESGFDLIVGADGAWSKIRKVLTDVMPVYSGVGGYESRIYPDAKDFEYISSLTNRGMWLSLGEQKSVICMQQGDGSLQATFWTAGSEDWQEKKYGDKGSSEVDAAKIKEVLHKEYKNWAKEYHAIIDAADPESLLPRSTYQLPTGLKWESRAGFTVIGDAAHLASPFAGEGVNAALLDACELADAVKKAVDAGAQGKEGLAPFVREFEEKMRVRTTLIQEWSWNNLCDMYLDPGAPATMIERYVTRNVVEHTVWWLKWPVGAIVGAIAYMYFGYVKWRLGVGREKISSQP